MTNVEPAEGPDQPPVSSREGITDERPAESHTAPSAQQRTWSMPKYAVTREHVDEIGRIAFTVITAIARFVADVVRAGASAIRCVWRAVGAVPAALQLFAGTGLLMLFGVVGAITLRNSVGLICIVVVVPVCSAILGVLGYRWYSGPGAHPTRHNDAQPAVPAASDLQRSVHYVDKKLAQALTSIGTEHHQQAVIALFQAKTAVELTLGTEQDDAGYVDIPLRAGDPRPRIRAGAGPTSSLRESNSLAAS